MAWDPKTYLAFADARTRPARDLLARVTLAAPQRVADLGCGPGNSTALLVERWPEARVEGIDNSPAMLAEAQESGVRAQWTLGDVAQWSPEARYDLIFSNATFQWVPDHPSLLPRLVSCLADGGVVAFQVPRNFREPCHTLIHEVASDPRWHAKLKGVRDWWSVLEPEAYYDLLAPHAQAIDIWETRYVQLLEGPDAVYRWMSGTGLRPFADALEGDERDAFLEEYRTRVASAYPERADGITLYPFQRLFCVAMRK
jgi:trans-aconitate 2-methyltransferase